VGHCPETTPPGNGLLQFFGKALVEFHDLTAVGANQVMMMIVPGTDELVPRGAVPEFHLPHKFVFLEQVHGTVDGGQIADVARQEIKYLPDGQRMRMLLHDL
jgi:hypothetical protein